MLRDGPTICHVSACPHGCTVETGCQGHAWREQAPAFYRQHAEDLVKRAAADGIVVTIEQRPLVPLAMGNFETVVHTRRARNS